LKDIFIIIDETTIGFHQSLKISIHFLITKRTIMKNNRLFILLAFLGISVAVVFTACKKDKDDDDSDNQTENLIAKSYFTVANSTFQGSVFPAAATSGSMPVIEGVYGNTSILEGGSNPVSIQSATAVKEALIGVQGLQGYYVCPATNMTTGDVHLVVLLFSQTLEKETFIIVIALRDNQGLVSAHETITVTRVEGGTGDLQVSCSWDKPNDVDLHLQEPAGEEIYYGMEQSSNGGLLDVDSNADCSLDYINNENITYGEDAIVESGNYIVRVDLYSNCEVPENTNFSVIARYKGQLIVPATGTNPYIGSFTPEDEDAGDEGSGRPVMAFSIAAVKAMGLDKNALKFEYSKHNRVKSPGKVR
jgi:hypothetical protein